VRQRLALVFALALGASACGRAPREVTATDDPWLAEAAARHRAADALLDRGDTAGARRELSWLFTNADPGGSDDQRRVLQDTCYRLARLDLDAGDARAALAGAERGLGLGRPADDLFVANLLLVRGAAHEALGDARAAADDYHRALVINDELLHREVERP
jgi:hypothetical protein